MELNVKRVLESLVGIYGSSTEKPCSVQVLDEVWLLLLEHLDEFTGIADELGVDDLYTSDGGGRVLGSGRNTGEGEHRGELHVDRVRYFSVT